MTTTISYTHLIHGQQIDAEWTGDESQAIAAAQERLNAERLCASGTRMHDGDWAYRADETGRWYRIDRDAMLELGAGTLDGAMDIYSIWCTRYGEELSLDEARECGLNITE